MNRRVKENLWFVATFALAVIFSLLIHPAVMVGTAIGVAMTSLKQIDIEV